MNIRIEKTVNGHYVGYVDNVPICKSLTEEGVHKNLDYLRNLPAYLFSPAVIN